MGKKGYYHYLKEQSKKTGKKYDKIIIRFAKKTIDNFIEAQRKTGVSLSDIRREMHK